MLLGETEVSTIMLWIQVSALLFSLNFVLLIFILICGFLFSYGCNVIYAGIPALLDIEVSSYCAIFQATVNIFSRGVLFGDNFPDTELLHQKPRFVVFDGHFLVAFPKKIVESYDHPHIHVSPYSRVSMT